VHHCRYCPVRLKSPLNIFILLVTWHSFGWIAAAFWAGVEIDEFPALKSWVERMYERPGVEKGRNVPDPHKMRELSKDQEKMKREAEKTKAWVQSGMAADSKK
jgi:glutathione S-transferase